MSSFKSGLWVLAEGLLAPGELERTRTLVIATSLEFGWLLEIDEIISSTLFPSCAFWPLLSTPRFTVLNRRFNERPLTFFGENEGKSAPGPAELQMDGDPGGKGGLGSGLRLPGRERQLPACC